MCSGICSASDRSLSFLASLLMVLLDPEGGEKSHSVGKCIIAVE